MRSKGTVAYRAHPRDRKMDSYSMHKNSATLIRAAMIVIAMIVNLVLLAVFISRSNPPATLGQESGGGATAALPQEPETKAITAERARWEARIAAVGTLRAYEEVKTEYTNRDFGIQHTIGHVIGELIYAHDGLKGLLVCDISFAFGCYHSFFARALAENGEGIVRTLDTACVERHGPFNTGCQHGIGHGILEYFGHAQILKALEACKLTTQVRDLFGCTSGVFMEFNFPVIVAAEKSTPTVREVDPKNPEAPCNTIVPVRFRRSCYYELGQWWEKVFSRNYQKLGSLCDAVTPENDLREYCFLGIGHVAAPSSLFNVEESIKKCAEMPTSEGVLACRAGASWSFFAQGERAIAPSLCAGLGEKSSECVEKSDLIQNNEIVNPYKKAE